jgi:hypothetical protein
MEISSYCIIALRGALRLDSHKVTRGFQEEEQRAVAAKLSAPLMGSTAVGTALSRHDSRASPIWRRKRQNG